MGLDLHGESQNAQHDFSKPHAEPVNIFLAVSEEIGSFSQLALESNSFTDGNEFLAARQKQENTHCQNIEVKSDDLIAQPGHDLGFVDNILTAVIEDNASLNCEMGREVNEDLE